MYADFFGLRELPFNNTPDPRYFFSTPDHEEALASLIYAVKQRKGFVLLTGEVGAGKTLVTRLMLRHFGAGIAFANVNHAIQTRDDLMESVCTEFELPFNEGTSHTQLVRLLHDYLLQRFAQNVPVVLILDEAQNIPIATFEELRMIGNLEADDAKLLQIAIVGQPELQRIFQSPELRQLKQRVFRAFHLPALDRRRTEGYIRYRLSVAAASDPGIFGADAIDRIYELSHGIPRLINTVCDNAMLSAYSLGKRRIDREVIDSLAPKSESGKRADAEPLNPARGDAVPPRRESQAPEPAIRTIHNSLAAPAPAPSRIAPPDSTTVPPPSRASQAEPPKTQVPFAPKAVPVNSTMVRDPAFEHRVLSSIADAEHRLQEALRRVSRLESQSATCAAETKDLTIAHAGLEALLARAMSLLDRAEATCREMERRVSKGGALCNDLREVGSGLHGLLGKLRHETALGKQIIAEVREVNSEASQQLDELKRSVTTPKRSSAAMKLPEAVSEIGETAAESTLLVREVPILNHRSGAINGVFDAGLIEGLLVSAQQSLAGLRRVADGSRNGKSGIHAENRSGAGLK